MPEHLAGGIEVPEKDKVREILAGREETNGSAVLTEVYGLIPSDYNKAREGEAASRLMRQHAPELATQLLEEIRSILNSGQTGT